MEAWIRDYRDRHPGANAWAHGSQNVCHQVETQGRIFRLAEQLRTGLDWPGVGPFFSMLHGLDEAVDIETPERARPSLRSAAAAAAVAYKLLFGRSPTLVEHDWLERFYPIGSGEIELGKLGLRVEGFDPIVIDGTDPAAYLWALYEMRQRQDACDEPVAFNRPRLAPPRCLAVEPPAEPSARNEPSVAATRELAAVGR